MRLSLNLDLPTHDLRVGGHADMRGRSFVGFQDREFKRFYPLVICLEALSQINEWQWQRANGKLPLLYNSGVRYEQEPIKPTPKEEWQDVIELYRARKGDCEDLACARVGELRYHGIAAVPALRYQKINEITLVHILVLWPDGFIEDPSKRLGMGGEFTCSF